MYMSVHVFLLCVASRLLVLVLWLQHETRQQRGTGPARVPALSCSCPLLYVKSPAWLMLGPGTPLWSLRGGDGAVAGTCAQRAAGSL